MQSRPSRQERYGILEFSAPRPSDQWPLEGAVPYGLVPLVISLWSLRPPQREMAIDGRSLRLSEVLSTPLSMPELPTDCGDWLADLAPLSLACLGSPPGSPLKGERSCSEHPPPSGELHRNGAIAIPQGSFAIKTSVQTSK